MSKNIPPYDSRDRFGSPIYKNLDRWVFRYGSTQWAGPYDSIEHACGEVSKHVKLTQEEEDLVVLASLTAASARLDGPTEIKDKAGRSKVILVKSLRGWWIRLSRRDVPA